MSFLVKQDYLFLIKKKIGLITQENQVGLALKNNNNKKKKNKKKKKQKKKVSFFFS